MSKVTQTGYIEDNTINTPSSGVVNLYAKSDGNLYQKNDTGLETQLGGGFSNPMTTTGDIIYATSGGTALRLGVGTEGQVLSVVSGIPEWTAGGGSGTVTSVTSANADITIATTTSTPVITAVQTPALRSASTTIDVSSATAPTSGQVLTATSSTAATWQTPNGGIARGTAQATTSGTSKTYTSLPSGLDRITFMLKGVTCTNPGGAAVTLRVGDSSGYVTSGYDGITCESYASSISTSAYTSGLVKVSDFTYPVNGTITLTRVSGNTWTSTTILSSASRLATGADPLVVTASSSISLSGTLDRLNFLITSGGATFNGGEVNILYE